MDLIYLYGSLLTFPNLDPVIFSIGPIDVRWYGLSYVLGILLGWYYAKYLISKTALWPQDKAPLTQKDIDDFVLWAAIGIVAGGRLGYILFYDFAAVSNDPMRIFQVWNGGMSFHGGLVGTCIAMILFAYARQIKVWNLFDITCAVAPIGLFFGRIANFINGELWGKLTNVPWAFIFPSGGPFQRHPSQLYEAALEGLVLLLILMLLVFRFKFLKMPGLIAGAFLIGYAMARIFVEFFREPDAHIGYLFGGWLTMGMLLSAPLLAIGVAAMLRARIAV